MGVKCVRAWDREGRCCYVSVCVVSLDLCMYMAGSDICILC